MRRRLFLGSLAMLGAARVSALPAPSAAPLPRVNADRLRRRLELDAADAIA